MDLSLSLYLPPRQDFIRLRGFGNMKTYSEPPWTPVWRALKKRQLLLSVSPNASQHHRNVPGESAITTVMYYSLISPRTFLACAASAKTGTINAAQPLRKCSSGVWEGCGCFPQPQLPMSEFQLLTQCPSFSTR